MCCRDILLSCRDGLLDEGTGGGPVDRLRVEHAGQRRQGERDGHRAQAEGDPRASSLFEPTPEFAAALLIVREWMHHLGFERLEFGVTSADHPKA